MAAAFAASHITGFFVPSRGDGPDATGSRGAGVNLGLGVISRVVARRGSGEVCWGDGSAEERRVTERVVALFADCRHGWDLTLFQEQPFPSGYGLGSSGAGALSMALALNAALGFPLAPAEAARRAHRAELDCRTGLGTVLAQTVGGLEVRLQPGAPGVGQVRTLPSERPLWAQVAVWAPLETSALLSQPGLWDRLAQEGERALESLTAQPGWERLMRLSRAFALDSDLASAEVLRCGHQLDEAGRFWSMPLFGQGVFWLTEGPDRALLHRISQDEPRPVFTWAGQLASQGARVVEVHAHTP